MIGHWVTVNEWSYLAWPQSWLTLTWEEQQHTDSTASHPIDTWCKVLTHVEIGQIKLSLYVSYQKLYQPSVDMTLTVSRENWIMFHYPHPRCYVCIAGWCAWVELGISWAQAWAYKSLKDIHQDESIRFTMKGPKAMPYEFGIYYLRGLCYLAGLHLECGLIGNKPEEAATVGLS